MTRFAKIRKWFRHKHDSQRVSRDTIRKMLEAPCIHCGEQTDYLQNDFPGHVYCQMCYCTYLCIKYKPISLMSILVQTSPTFKLCLEMYNDYHDCDPDSLEGLLEWLSTHPSKSTS